MTEFAYERLKGTGPGLRWLAVTSTLALGLLLSASVFASVEHRLFDEVLQAHVTSGKVDYPSVAKDPRFAQYLELLANTDPEGLATRKDKLAYWINAYNAFAIKGIIDGGSPSTFFGRIGYFKNTTYDAGSEEINLYDLERDVLIPLGEPRIHFAIVCASSSCPLLRSRAYTADGLEQQLEASARDFVNDSRRNLFDREDKIARLSKVFDWFDKDFVAHSGNVQRYVAKYVEDQELARELANGDYKIDHLKYNWSLNGTPPTAG